MRLREMLADMACPDPDASEDDSELEILLSRWFRRLPPEDRVEVIRESLRAAVRIYTEYRPDLAWMTNVIERIHALDENKVAEILKRPLFEERGPPLGFFSVGLADGITAVLWQGEGFVEKSELSLFATAVVTLANTIYNAAEAFLNPEGFRATETHHKLVDEWMKAGQKPEDPLVREMTKLRKVIDEKGRPVDEEARDWVRQVVEPIIRRIDVEIDRGAGY